MKKIPVRVFKVTHFSDITMECESIKEAQDGAIELVKAGHLILEKQKEGTLLALSLKAPDFIAIPGVRSDKIH